MSDTATNGVGISPIGAISNAIGSVFGFLQTNKEEDIAYQVWLNSAVPQGGIYISKEEDGNGSNNLIIIGILAITLVGIVFAISFKRKNN